MLDRKKSIWCLKIVRTPVYFLYMAAVPAFAASNNAPSAPIVPASDVQKLAGEFNKIKVAAAASDRKWLEDMMIRLHLLDATSAEIRETKGLTDRDRQLTAKRKDYNAVLNRMGLDADLSPNTADEQKVLSDLFASLGIDTKTAEQVTASQRRELLLLVEKFYATGVDSANAEKLLITVTQSHAEILAQIADTMGRLNGKQGSPQNNSDTASRTELIATRLEQSYREIPAPRYFELRTEIARNPTNPASTQSFLGRVSDEFLSFGLRVDDPAAALKKASLVSTERNDESRIPASAPSAAPVAAAAPSAVQNITQAAVAQPVAVQAQPLATSVNYNAVQMIGQVQKPAPVAAGKSVEGKDKESANRSDHSMPSAPVDHVESPAVATRAVVGSADSVSAVPANVAGAAAGTDADSVVSHEAPAGGAKVIVNVTPGIAAGYLRQIQQKVSPIVKVATGYFEGTKQRIKNALGLFGIGAKSNGKQAATEIAAETSTDPKPATVADRAPASVEPADLLPPQSTTGDTTFTAAADAPLGTACRSAESDFLQAHHAAAAMLENADQNTVNKAIQEIAGNDGALSASGWKANFDSKLAVAGAKSAGVRAYHEAFQQAWMSNENQNLDAKPCDSDKSANFRAEIAALTGGGSDQVTAASSNVAKNTADRAPASSSGSDVKVPVRGDGAGVVSNPAKSTAALTADIATLAAPNSSAAPAQADATKTGIFTSVRHLAGQIGTGLMGAIAGKPTVAVAAPVTASAPSAGARTSDKPIAKVDTNSKSKIVTLRSVLATDAKKTCLPKNDKHEVVDFAFNNLSCRNQFRSRFITYVNGSEQFKTSDYQRCLSYAPADAGKENMDRVQAILFSSNSDCLLEGARPDPERTELRTAQFGGGTCAQLKSLSEPEAEDKARIVTLNTFIEQTDSAAHDSSDSYNRLQTELTKHDAQASFMKNFTTCTDKNQWGNYVVEAEKALRNATAMACGSSEAFVVSYAFDKDRSSKVLEDYLAANPEGRQEIYSRITKGVDNVGKGHFDDDRRSTLLFDDIFHSENEVSKANCPRLVSRYQFYLGLILNSDLKRAWLRSIPLNASANGGRHTASNR